MIFHVSSFFFALLTGTVALGPYTHNSLIRYLHPHRPVENLVKIGAGRLGPHSLVQASIKKNVTNATNQTIDEITPEGNAPDTIVCCCVYDDTEDVPAIATNTGDGEEAQSERLVAATTANSAASFAIFDDTYEGVEDGVCDGGWRATVFSADDSVALQPFPLLSIDSPEHESQAVEKGQVLNEYCRTRFCPVKESGVDRTVVVEADDAAFADVVAAGQSEIQPVEVGLAEATTAEPTTAEPSTLLFMKYVRPSRFTMAAAKSSKNIPYAAKLRSQRERNSTDLEDPANTTTPESSGNETSEVAQEIQSQETALEDVYQATLANVSVKEILRRDYIMTVASYQPMQMASDATTFVAHGRPIGGFQASDTVFD